MDKPLSQEAQSRIGELCESIARRDLLDVDAQEELRGHIEDKVIAYLDGREALSELDAVVLAREHFGSPDTSESYLHAFHLNRLDANVVRRLAQLVFVSYAIQFIAVLMLRTFLYGNPLAAYSNALGRRAITPELMVSTSGFIVVSVACVLIVLRKTTVLRRFQDVSTRTTAIRAFIAIALSTILPTVADGPYTTDKLACGTNHHSRHVFADLVLHMALVGRSVARFAGTCGRGGVRMAGNDYAASDWCALCSSRRTPCIR